MPHDSDLLDTKPAGKSWPVTEPDENGACEPVETLRGPERTGRIKRPLAHTRIAQPSPGAWIYAIEYNTGTSFASDARKVRTFSPHRHSTARCAQTAAGTAYQTWRHRWNDRTVRGTEPVPITESVIRIALWSRERRTPSAASQERGLLMRRTLRFRAFRHCPTTVGTNAAIQFLSGINRRIETSLSIVSPTGYPDSTIHFH
ncbi:hypothetical protein [Burkholderia sp. RS02]|uniref:hypothetical protein n=1 Tax=unclassified Burkholderia TaxID=2613784 RepID=UPI0032183161